MVLECMAAGAICSMGVSVVLKRLEFGEMMDLVEVLVSVLMAVGMVLEGIVGIGSVVVLQRLNFCCICCFVVVVL